MIGIIIFALLVWFICYFTKRARQKKQKIARYAELKAREKTIGLSAAEHEESVKLSFEIREHEIEELGMWH